MQPSDIQRLEAVITELRKKGHQIKSVNELLRSTDMKPSNASKTLKSGGRISQLIVDRIRSVYPEVNPAYLLFDHQPILLGNPIEQKDNMLMVEEGKQKYEKEMPKLITQMEEHIQDLRSTIELVTKSLEDKEKIIRLLEERK